MISYEDARSLIKKSASVLPAENIPLKECAGRVVAEDIKARRTLPPYDVSAMDGYAIRDADLKNKTAFRVLREAPAGVRLDSPLEPGEAVRIFTGGYVPPGADRIVIQENARANGDMIEFSGEIGPSLHIRKAGIDFTEGHTLVAKGQSLNAIHVSLLAAAGFDQIPVSQRPRLAIFSNGDELRDVGEPLGDTDIVASTPYALAEWARQWGAKADYLGIARDDLDHLSEMIERARDYDIIVPLGGASVGDYDYVKSGFDKAGYKPVFSKVAVKPGKPTWFGTLGHAQVLGLPGNPASGLVCARIFLRLLVNLMTGRNDSHTPETVYAVLSEPLGSNGSRALFSRARAEPDEAGQLKVTPFPRQDSSLLTPFARANCLIYQPPGDPGGETGARAKIIWL